LLNFNDRDLWEKLKDMEKRCSDHEAKWEARQRLERGPNETQQQDWEDAITKQYNEWYHDSLYKNTKLCEVSRSLITTLQRYLKSGGIPAPQARRAILMAEEMISNAIRDNVILKGYKNQVRGEFLDVPLRASDADMAYVDAIISCQEDPEGTAFKLKTGERDKNVQNRWRKGLLNSYGANRTNESGEELEWCHLARTRFRRKSEQVVAAHLVPKNMGEYYCDHLFGPLDNE
jgi:hypothetical protein